MNDEYGYSEGGEMVDRRAGDRRAAAPVVAVVAADLSSLTRYHHNEFSKEIHNDPIGEYYLVADVQALGSQAQAAVSAPVGNPLATLYAELNRITWEGEDKGWNLAISAVQKRIAEVLAAQAAVGVASQQEQQPQPSCMPPFAAPASQHNERNAVLDEVAASIIHTFDANEVMRPAYVAECILSHKNKRAAPGSQHDANSAADDQWVFDLAAEHESNRYGLFGLVTFNTTGLVNFSRAIEAELASRFRAPGGNTNDKASPDLASIASQAQGDPDKLPRYDHRGAHMVPDQTGDYVFIGDVRCFVRALKTPTARTKP